MKTANVIDRLDKHLKLHGIELKRAQVLEIAAGALGYRNSNTLAAEVAKSNAGPFRSAEKVKRIQVEDVDLIILRDPLANALYALEATFVEQAVEDDKGEHAGITPYGHIVDLTSIADAPERPDKTSKNPDRYIIGMALDGQNPSDWWSDAEGWGQIQTATVYNRTEGRLPTAGLEERDIGWYRLPTPIYNSVAKKVQVEPGLKNALIESKGCSITFTGNVTDRMLEASVNAPGQPGDWWETRISKAVGISWTGKQSDPMLVPRDTLLSARDLEAFLTSISYAVGLNDIKPINAIFQPQAWINDNAVMIDTDQDKTFDITYEILQMGVTKATALKDDSDDADNLKEAVAAPRWIKNHNGPFAIMVENAIEAWLTKTGGQN